MITVNSLSGGKTSSYVAAHYKADVDVFSLVCIDDHNAGVYFKRKENKHLLQVVNDRLQKYCSNQPEFVATAEDPTTIRTILELEQFIGREIVWLRGPGFHKAINERQSLPNRNKRWCTTILKITPIFWFLYLYYSLPARMRIGYRFDEKERADTFRETFFYPNNCEYRPNSNTWIHRWTEQPFRIGEFPLIEDEITQRDVIEFWNGKPVQFPLDSNCQFCFWKKPQQLRRNFDTNPSIMLSALVMEALHDNRFHDGISMKAVRKSGIQVDAFDLNWSGCHGGYCSS